MTTNQELAIHLGISPLEVRERISNGEPIAQAFYEWKYNWDINDESTIPF